MFDAERGVRDALAAMVGELDPAAIPLGSVMDLWETFDAVEKLAAAAKVLLAARVEQSAAWRRSGHRCAAEALAARAGTSVGAARDTIATSTRLEHLPRVQAAVRAGAMSPQQVACIAEAASADPTAEQRLLGKARRASLHELRDECLRTRAAADPDRERTHRRIHEQRHLRTFTDGEGAWNLHVRTTPDQGARIERVLDPLVDGMFREARAERRHEPREAYACDALEQAVTGTRAAREGTNINHLALVRVDLAALRRGAARADELCEITGIGPIPATTARDLLGESILKLVITKGVDVLHVTHLGRGPSAAQKVAWLWMSPTCAVEGCNRRRTEFDHRTPFAQTRHTRLDDSDPLCHHHHHQKTYDNWALVDGTGKRPIVPPDDPRHPKNRPRSPA